MKMTFLTFALSLFFAPLIAQAATTCEVDSYICECIGDVSGTNTAEVADTTDIADCTAPCTAFGSDEGETMTVSLQCTDEDGITDVVAPVEIVIPVAADEGSVTCTEGTYNCICTYGSTSWDGDDQSSTTISSCPDDCDEWAGNNGYSTVAVSVTCNESDGTEMTFLASTTMTVTAGADSAAAATATTGSTAVSTITLYNPLGEDDVRIIIGRVIRGILSLIGSLALLMFIYGGVLWLTSAGAADRVKKGKDILVWATMGLGVIFGSYAAVNAILNALTEGNVRG